MRGESRYTGERESGSRNREVASRSQNSYLPIIEIRVGRLRGLRKTRNICQLYIAYSLNCPKQNDGHGLCSVVTDQAHTKVTRVGYFNPYKEAGKIYARNVSIYLDGRASSR